MTEQFVERVSALNKEAKDALAAITTKEQLEQWRIRYLGRKGELPQLLRELKEVPEDQRRSAGGAGNEIRAYLTQEYKKKEQVLQHEEAGGEPTEAPIAATSPIPPQGHLHPLTLTMRSIVDIFTRMGFLIVEGPEVEDARHNFDFLNIPLEHPARAETDTFYIKDRPDLVLRTHVSSLQTRGVFEKNLVPPFRIMYFGPSYRAEKEDATHAALFQQYEFMVVEENINLGNLKGIIEEVYSSFFGKKTHIQFRPSYFPFVEPGLEVHMQDTITNKGGWLEMAGAGMVHPNVLKNINVNPEKYQGIALGGGLDRLAMLKYGIPDIRLFYTGDIQFLTQFS